jgi:hypothetical protein
MLLTIEGVDLWQHVALNVRYFEKTSSLVVVVRYRRHRHRLALMETSRSWWHQHRHRPSYSFYSSSASLFSVSWFAFVVDSDSKFVASLVQCVEPSFALVAQTPLPAT